MGAARRQVLSSDGLDELEGEVPEPVSSGGVSGRTKRR